MKYTLTISDWNTKKVIKTTEASTKKEVNDLANEIFKEFYDARITVKNAEGKVIQDWIRQKSHRSPAWRKYSLLPRF